MVQTHVWYCLYHISVFTDVIHDMFTSIIRNNEDMQYRRVSTPKLTLRLSTYILLADNLSPPDFITFIHLCQIVRYSKCLKRDEGVNS